MSRVLIAEDEDNMRSLIKEYLVLEGYEYSEAKDGMEALNLFNVGKYDALILDVMMPKVDGWSVCKQIRKLSDVPVIMLTARGEEYDRLFGFELGVDDYITKPFSPRELMARLKAVIRRSKKDDEEGSTGAIVFDGLKIDISARSVYVDDMLIKLTPKEYDMLVYLASNKNLALNRQQILDGVWGVDFFGDDRTVDTHIKMLRESIKEYKHFIITVWGVGYKFVPGVVRQ